MWEGLEKQPFDVVMLGNEVGSVTALSVGDVGCRENTARAQGGSRLFECQAPANASAESTYFYATVSYATGAADTRIGPFHTLSRATWEAVNGQFYFRSLDAYVLAQTSATGPVIALNAVALSGNPGDLPPARYFNELRVSGPGGTQVCPYAGSGWRCQCPALVPGVYVVEVLREQSQLRVINDRFIVLVNAVGAAPPGPVPPQPPTPVPLPPSCNPATDKGC